jgi:hypothetical protein
VARTEVVPKSRHVVYLRRAEEFADQMEIANENEAWNTVGLLGVHTTISACDALTVARTGQRWSGQDHAGLRDLVEALRIPGASEALKQISDVLSVKNRVEYEARPFSPSEARILKKQAARVLTWVRENLQVDG